MMKKRGPAIMISAFAVVLIAGVAVAQIADVLPGDDGTGIEAPSLATAAHDDTATIAANGSEKPDEATATRLETPKDDRTAPDDDAKDDPPAGEPNDEAPDDDGPAPDENEDAEPADTTSPGFTILSPDDGAHVDDPVIEVAGEVEPGAKVMFAGRYRADVTDDGRWRIALKLEPGENRFTLVATDAAGNASEASVTVYYDAATDHRVTANQKWEIVDGPTAANKYYGTGVPGARVWIGSEKGGGEQKVTVADNGEWFATVEFPEAPCHEWFTVVVEADGFRDVFEMKWVCEKDHDFTAAQKWEIVDGPTAANKYYGTGVPGARVWIGSEKGGGEQKVTVADNGEWFATVEFPEAPCHEWFTVVVEADGFRDVFEMKWVCPDAGEIDFTAAQKYGSCGEAIPYDVFWGTEDAGAKIEVSSKYGSGWTKANANGEWELRVEFPEAPVGKTFEVVVESTDGGREVFTFTRTAAGGA